MSISRTCVAHQTDRIVHGNAGHVAQGWRTDTLRNLVTQPHTHVFTIDYRGFGHSTGSPTEAGLITDGVALVNFILRTVGVPPEQIVILGQSLGTAVASAVGLEFADPNNKLHPSRDQQAEQAPLLINDNQPPQPTIFAGIVLVAPFSNLPSLMLTYRIGGFLPILLPLRPFPSLARMLTSRMVDKWSTSDRLRAYHESFQPRAEHFQSVGGRRIGSLQLIHATNDLDISFHQTEMICRRMLGEGQKCVDGSKGNDLVVVRNRGRPDLRLEIIEHGGEIAWAMLCKSVPQLTPSRRSQSNRDIRSCVCCHFASV